MALWHIYFFLITLDGYNNYLGGICLVTDRRLNKYLKIIQDVFHPCASLLEACRLFSSFLVFLLSEHDRLQLVL